LSEHNRNANEWVGFDQSLISITDPAYLIFEAMVFVDDGDVIKDNVNIAIDDVTFTPQCK
jgi:hypothetical protein